MVFLLEFGHVRIPARPERNNRRLQMVQINKQQLKEITHNVPKSKTTVAVIREPVTHQNCDCLAGRCAAARQHTALLQPAVRPLASDVRDFVLTDR